MDPFEVMQQQINDLRSEVKTLRSQQVLRGEVRSVNPLRISLDLDPNTVLADAPENLAPVLNVGDFVYCQLVGGRLIILGRTIEASEKNNIVMVNGIPYRTQGRFIRTVSLSNQVGALFTADVQIQMPKSPPDGYRYSFTALGNGSTMWAGTVTGTLTGIVTVRIVGALKYRDRQVVIDWTLIPIS